MVGKVVALLLAFALITGSIVPPVFAAEQKERSLWKIIADSFKDFKIREQDKLKPVKKVGIFQEMSDGIEEGEKKARPKSLRGGK